MAMQIDICTALTLLSYRQIKIVDEKRNEVPTGTMGELLIKSPSVFL